MPFPLFFQAATYDEVKEYWQGEIEYNFTFTTCGGIASVKSEPKINAVIEYPSSPDGEIKIVITQTHDVTVSYDIGYVIVVGLISILSFISSLKGIVILAAQKLKDVIVDEQTSKIHITCTITFNG